MRKNNLSEKLEIHYRRLRLILSLGLIAGLTSVNLFWLHAYNNFGFFLLFELIIISVASIRHFLSWYGVIKSPKYIEWNETGIKIISLRGKKEFVEWKDVGSIQWCGEIDFLMKKFSEYILIIDGKLNSFRYLEPKIAKQLIEAWQKYGEGPSENYRPPGANKQ